MGLVSELGEEEKGPGVEGLGERSWFLFRSNFSLLLLIQQIVKSSFIISPFHH